MVHSLTSPGCSLSYGFREQVRVRLNRCAGGILWAGQEEGAARIGNTGEPFDEPRAQKTPALRVALEAGARGVVALDRIADTLFARRLADRLAPTQRSCFNLTLTCSMDLG
jgi:hypothetical protein